MRSINPLLSSVAFLLSLLIFNAESYAQNTGTKVQDEITAANKKFIDLYNQSGGAGVASLYADNAMILPPNSEPISDNAAIGKFWKGAFDAGIKKVKLETLSVDAAGSTASETGKYTLYDANDNMIDTGKYLVFWKKEKGSWKLYRDIWNTSAPAK